MEEGDGLQSRNNTEAVLIKCLKPCMQGGDGLSLTTPTEQENSPAIAEMTEF